MSFLYASGRIENHPNQENMIHNLIGYFLETHNKLKNKNFEELLTEVKKNNIQVKKVDDDIYEFNQSLNVKNKTTLNFLTT